MILLNDAGVIFWKTGSRFLASTIRVEKKLHNKIYYRHKLEIFNEIGPYGLRGCGKQPFGHKILKRVKRSKNKLMKILITF